MAIKLDMVRSAKTLNQNEHQNESNSNVRDNDGDIIT